MKIRGAVSPPRPALLQERGEILCPPHRAADAALVQAALALQFPQDPSKDYIKRVIGVGGDHDSTWCLFSADVDSGKLAVLSKVGTFYGRAPEVCQISPDGHRLMLLTSLHLDAFNYPLFRTMSIDRVNTRFLRYLFAKRSLLRTPLRGR